MLIIMDGFGLAFLLLNRTERTRRGRHRFLFQTGKASNVGGKLLVRSSTSRIGGAAVYSMAFVAAVGLVRTDLPA